MRIQEVWSIVTGKLWDTAGQGRSTLIHHPVYPVSAGISLFHFRSTPNLQQQDDSVQISMLRQAVNAKTSEGAHQPIWQKASGEGGEHFLWKYAHA